GGRPVTPRGGRGGPRSRRPSSPVRRHASTTTYNCPGRPRPQGERQERKGDEAGGGCQEGETDGDPPVARDGDAVTRELHRERPVPAALVVGRLDELVVGERPDLWLDDRRRLDRLGRRGRRRRSGRQWHRGKGLRGGLGGGPGRGCGDL